MSSIPNNLILAYKGLLEERKTSAARELHAFIRRRFPDANTSKKLRDVKRDIRLAPVNKVYEERIPQFAKTALTYSRTETVIGTPKKTSPDDMTIEDLLTLLAEGEEAVVLQFGSVDAWKKYTEDRFEGLDYGRRSAFKSLAEAFADYVEGTNTEEEEEVVEIFTEDEEEENSNIDIFE